MPSWLWATEILSPNVAASLLIGIISLGWAQAQFAASVKPFLTYSCLFHNAPVTALESASKKIFRVTIQNPGMGLAIVHNMTYRIGVAPNRARSDAPKLEYCDAIKELESHKFKYGKDFVLGQMSFGAVIAPKDSLVVAEFPLEMAQSLPQCDIEIEFEGILGDIYSKEIYCIPRQGIILDSHSPLWLPS
ncbi:MAG: hypothetical protein A3G41_00660 [Elusimicrobia bacterium RIFCSPLOWO2_12_FULL_59_9]|nr:MAG: hypothetical protein A3G41_00660 [Elusimicrobia bacterium RIFCSPLOWO2_12_FULL_59_9]